LKPIVTYAAPFLALSLSACIGVTAPSLVPGASTVAAVDARLGWVTEVRARTGGETVRYYSRQPWGYETYAARMGADGRLRSLEQLLTAENVGQLHAAVSRAEQVRDLLGPPYSIDAFPRLEREVWSYKLQAVSPQPKDLIVQFSRDGVVREIYLLDEQRWASGALDVPGGVS